MRSLFGALFGLVIGILVSALLKNNQLWEVLKEVFKNPSYLSLIIAFAILGWLIGMSGWKKAQTISSTKEGDRKENIKNSIAWEEITLLILIVVGVIVTFIKNSGGLWAFIFIAINEIIWIVLLLVKRDRLNNIKFLAKPQSSSTEDKNKRKPD